MSEGMKTSEFKLTVAAQLVGVILEAIAMVLHSMQDAGLGGQFVVGALVVCGVLLQIATLLGYQKARAIVKQAEVVSQSPAANSLNLGSPK